MLVEAGDLRQQWAKHFELNYCLQDVKEKLINYESKSNVAR